MMRDLFAELDAVLGGFLREIGGAGKIGGGRDISRPYNWRNNVMGNWRNNVMGNWRNNVMGNWRNNAMGNWRNNAMGNWWMKYNS